MDSKRRMSIEDDRLSVLPDDLILKILSFLSLKQVIGTSILSTRWRHVWTSIPHLSLSTQDISTDFVAYVLSRRNNRVQLSSINLFLRLKDDQINVAQNIMNQAFSLDAQQLNLRCSFGKIAFVLFKPIEPLFLSLPSSQTLKHLTLRRSCFYSHITLTSTRELLSLTTLHLDYVTLYDGFFSMCPNLENLTVINCNMIGSNGLRICHPRLSNLTLNNGDCATSTTNVVTPQLKSLTINDFCGSYLISAPELASLVCRGMYPFMFSTDGFHSLEKAQLSLSGQTFSHASKIVSLLQKLHSVKFLSLSRDIIQILNASVEVNSHQPSPFAHLKSLNILPKVECLCKHELTKLIMSTKVKNFLLNSSPKATLTELQPEHCCEMRAARGPLGSF